MEDMLCMDMTNKALRLRTSLSQKYIYLSCQTEKLSLNIDARSENILRTHYILGMFSEYQKVRKAGLSQIWAGLSQI